MSQQEETYGDARRRELETMLRTLAARILELDATGQVLAHAPELMKTMGEIRSELFHYEVRATYDTPEVAENRRIVAEAQANDEWTQQDWAPDDDTEDEP